MAKPHLLEREIEIAPMFHRLPDRIRAHVQICFIALVLHCVMRMRLKAAGSKTSPERALAYLTLVSNSGGLLCGQAQGGLPVGLQGDGEGAVGHGAVLVAVLLASTAAMKPSTSCATLVKC